jgi:hypothetical protein
MSAIMGISKVDLTRVEKREITELIATVSLTEEYLLLRYQFGVGLPSVVRSMIAMAMSPMVPRNQAKSSKSHHFSTIVDREGVTGEFLPFPGVPGWSSSVVLM